MEVENYTSSDSNINKLNKTNPLLLLVIVVLLLIIVGGGAFLLAKYLYTTGTLVTNVPPASREPVALIQPQTSGPADLNSAKELTASQDAAITASLDKKTYTSERLGISFNYSVKINDDGSVAQVKEEGNKIYVYNSTLKDYKEGQWVQVFSKESQQSLNDAVKRRFLANYSANDCFVSAYTPKPSSYPATYRAAIIDVPHAEGDDLETLSQKWEKCPQPYVAENGISYFLEDPAHPTKYVYFSIGQYGIPSGINSKAWQDTLKFIN